jgi:hypothetical protein
MSITKTGVKVHDDACNTAEMNRQVAVAAAGTQAAVTAAELIYYRACKTSALANGVSPVPFITALHDLGTGGV